MESSEQLRQTLEGLTKSVQGLKTFVENASSELKSKSKEEHAAFVEALKANNIDKSFSDLADELSKLENIKSKL